MSRSVCIYIWLKYYMVLYWLMIFFVFSYSKIKRKRQYQKKVEKKVFFEQIYKLFKYKLSNENLKADNNLYSIFFIFSKHLFTLNFVILNLNYNSFINGLQHRRGKEYIFYILIYFKYRVIRKCVQQSIWDNFMKSSDRRLWES